jgi:hypothetical protein
MSKLIFLTDIIEQRVRKEQEIEYYEEELRKIEDKLFWLRKEKQLTETIIEIINSEKVLDIQQYFLEKKDDS